MPKLKEFFDDFSFHARVLPAITLLVPVIILGIYKGFIYQDIIDLAQYAGLSLVVITFLAKIGREKGKNYEEKMYKELGAKPTTIVMRYTDNRIDSVTKTRYHKIIGDKIGYALPSSSIDEVDGSDVLYESGMTHLRNYANSHRDTEKRVYQELKDYNYWRNLYGCKYYALAVYIVLGIRELFLIQECSIMEMVKNPFPKYVSFILMAACGLIMSLCVTKRSVERKAFDYAKTLAEVCERL